MAKIEVPKSRSLQEMQKAAPQAFASSTQTNQSTAQATPKKSGGTMSFLGDLAKSAYKSVARPLFTPVAGVISGITGHDVELPGWAGNAKASLDLNKQSKIAGGAALEAAALIPGGGLASTAGKTLTKTGATQLAKAGTKELVKQGVKEGVLSGAFGAAGATLGDKEDATLADVFTNGLIGGLAGGATGALVPLASKGISKVLTKGKGGKVAGEAVEGAIKPNASVSLEGPKMTMREKVAGIQPSTKTLITTADNPKATLDSFENMMSTAKKAAVDPRAPTPLEKAGEQAENALTKIKQTMQEVGGRKGDILKIKGSRPIEEVRSVVKEFDDGLGERFGGSIVDDGKGKFTISPLEGRRLKIDDHDVALLSNVRRELHTLGEKPSAQMVDDAIDYLQGQLYKAKQNTALPVDDSVISYAKGALSKLNDIQQNIVGEDYVNTNTDYRELKGMFDWLNSNLGKEGAKGGSLMKRVFSPSDAGTKEMFEKIRQATGVDLVQDATFAKLAMELAGDARQSNLLEQLQVLMPGGGSLSEKLISKAAEMVRGKVADPEDLIRRMITKQGLEGVAEGGAKELNPHIVGISLDKALAKGPELKAYVDKTADDIAAKIGGIVAKAPVKGRTRALQKVMADYKGDVSQLGDIARNTIIANDEKGMFKALQEISAHPSFEKAKVIKPGDWANGYSGMNIKVKAPNGMFAETQINTPEMIFAKDSEENARKALGNDLFDKVKAKMGNIEGGKGHSIYEQIRDLKAKDEAKFVSQIKKLEEESKRYYDSVRAAYRGNSM